MSHTSMIISGLMLVAMAIYVTPSVLVLNQGKLLRNLALWVAVFLGLMLVYKNIGPGSPHPLFQDKAANIDTQDSAQIGSQPAAKDKDDGSQGFTPPSE